MDRKKQILILCRWLRAWRIEKKFSQENVTFATGIDVSNYDSERCEPGLYNLMRLCDFYGLSLPWLLKKVEDIEAGLVTEEELMKLAHAVQRIVESPGVSGNLKISS